MTSSSASLYLYTILQDRWVWGAEGGGKVKGKNKNRIIYLVLVSYVPHKNSSTR